MKNKLLIILALGSLMLSGCGSKYSILSTNYEVEKIQIENKLSEVIIIDKRVNVTDRKIKLPFISFPWQHDKVSPTLTGEQKQMIKEQVQTYFSGKGESVNVKCIIVQGYKEFTAHVFHEREYVQVDIRVELLDLDNNIIKHCTSSVFFEAKSLDATYKYINKIYNKAIRTSIYKCFKKLKE